MDDELVSARVLADWCDVTVRAIQGYAQKGIIRKEGRGKYPHKASCKAVMRHLRSMAGNGSGSAEEDANLSLERALLAREQREIAALKKGELKKELVRADAVSRTWQNILRRVRSRMLAVPSQVGAALPHFTRADVEAMDKEIREALTELADEGDDAVGR